MCDCDRKLDRGQVIALLEEAFAACRHPAPDHPSCTTETVRVDVALAVLRRMSAAYHNPPKKGCPMPSHHPTCDCDGEGGDR